MIQDQSNPTFSFSISQLCFIAVDLDVSSRPISISCLRLQYRPLGDPLSVNEAQKTKPFSIFCHLVPKMKMFRTNILL